MLRMRVLNLEPADTVLEEEGDSAIICVRCELSLLLTAGMKVGPYLSVHRREPGLPSAIARFRWKGMIAVEGCVAARLSYLQNTSHLNLNQRR